MTPRIALANIADELQQSGFRSKAARLRRVANALQVVGWQAIDTDLNHDRTFTRDIAVADTWRKAGLTVRPLYAMTTVKERTKN